MLLFSIKALLLCDHGIFLTQVAGFIPFPKGYPLPNRNDTCGVRTHALSEWRDYAKTFISKGISIACGEENAKEGAFIQARERGRDQLWQLRVISW